MERREGLLWFTREGIAIILEKAQQQWQREAAGHDACAVWK